MRSDIFFDTNVLLYLPDGDVAKAERTEQLLVDGGVINTLVMCEASYVLVKSWKWKWPDALEMLTTFRANTIVLPLTDEAHQRGMAYAKRYKLQVFDAVLVAAAVLAGCTTFLSEDMQDGLKIDGVIIRNPFR